MAIPNILSGSTIAAGGTIITIPANSYWEGHINLSGAVIVASGAAAQSAHARVSVVGANSVPPAGTYLRVDLHAPASALAAVGTHDSKTHSTPFAVSTGANSVDLVLNSSNTTAQ